jgi:ATP-dependent RNA helicase DHX29
MRAFNVPEMLRMPLDEVALQIRFLELGLVQPFLMSALDAPDAGAVAHAVQLLQAIGAMDEEQVLSPLGYHLAKMPVPPKVCAHVHACVRVCA